MLLIREQMDFPHVLWNDGYLTYGQQIVGFCAQSRDLGRLKAVSRWLKNSKIALQAFLAATSPRLFGQKATALTARDILNLPNDEREGAKITPHEEILVADIVDYYRDLVRLGEDSSAMKNPGAPALDAFNELFNTRINGVYKRNKLKALSPLVLDGVICQPYVFGSGKIDWPEKTDDQKLKLDGLLHEKRGAGLNVTRIARIYDGACIYLIKPDRLRYWLRSVALRDADETLADLSAQGF